MPETAAEPQHVEVRAGWEIACPHCGESMRYTIFRIDPPRPFFHESVGSDILLRESDDRRVRESPIDFSTPDDVLERLWLEIVRAAPPAPSGGTYSLWAHAHCPVCRRELPYDGGRRDLHTRLWDDAIVVMDGARVTRDRDTYVVRVDPARPATWKWLPAIGGLLLILAFLLAACGATAWPKTAAETSCAEWTGQMTEVQRDSVGAAMLLALRQSDGATVRPPDEVLEAFSNAVGDVCADNPGQTIAAVGATIYSLSDDLKP